MYRYFDFCIDCDFALRGPLPCDGGETSWRVRRTAEIDETGFSWFHDWKSPDGAILMSAARRGEDYLLDCLGEARFRIDFEQNCIEALPRGRCTEQSLAHLLLDQVLPRAVCHAGRTVLHASAVKLEDGRAVAFAGPTGRGKSTLATAFHREGFELITDDCLLLDERNDRVFAIPAYPSLRLWSDSAEELVGEGQRLVEMAHYSAKKQLLVDSGATAASESGIELAALFLIEPPREQGVRIKQAGGKSVLMALIEDTFALDVVDRPSVQRAFESAGRLARSLPIFRLGYPRDYRKLSQVIANITKFNQLPSRMPSL
jgi:hypothetical protein